jgi:hypothetical protein
VWATQNGALQELSESVVAIGQAARRPLPQPAFNRVDRVLGLPSPPRLNRHKGRRNGAHAPESHYSWDSTVPNHAALSAGDAIAVWDKQQLLGASVIEEIEVGASSVPSLS